MKDCVRPEIHIYYWYEIFLMIFWLASSETWTGNAIFYGKKTNTALKILLNKIPTKIVCVINLPLV